MEQDKIALKFCIIYEEITAPISKGERSVERDESAVWEHRLGSGQLVLTMCTVLQPWDQSRSAEVSAPAMGTSLRFRRVL